LKGSGAAYLSVKQNIAGIQAGMKANGQQQQPFIKLK
jgi:hypothetical protein